MEKVQYAQLLLSSLLMLLFFFCVCVLLQHHLAAHFDAVHLGVKPHGCPRCSSLFADKSNMRRHLQSCQGGRIRGESSPALTVGPPSSQRTFDLRCLRLACFRFFPRQ